VYNRIVMISNYSRFHNVAMYLRRYTSNRIVMAIGVPTLSGLFEEQYYSDLGGGILEAFGLLFQGPLKLYVYPRQHLDTGEITTAETFFPPPSLMHLYTHLLENHFIEPIQKYRFAHLDVLPRDVLQIIQDGDPIWETLVPVPIAERIKSNRLFGYRALAIND